MNKYKIKRDIETFENEIRILEASAILYPECRRRIYEVIDYYWCCIGYLQDLIIK